MKHERIRVFVSVLFGLALLGVATLAHAAKGDVGEKGEQIYIWHFDEGKGKTVKEANGKGPEGVFTGPIEWTEGVSETGLLLSGQPGDPQFVEFDGSDHLDITEAITLGAWVYLDELPQGDQANKGTIVYKNTYYLQIEPPNGNLAYYFYDTAPPGYHISSVSVKPKEWNHVAVTWDGSTIRFYVNGKQDPVEIDQKGPGRSTPGKTVRLGGENNNCCPRFLNGKVDDLLIANYALSEGDINDLINTALDVRPAGKLATRWAALKTR